MLGCFSPTLLECQAASVFLSFECFRLSPVQFGGLAVTCSVVAGFSCSVVLRAVVYVLTEWA